MRLALKLAVVAAAYVLWLCSFLVLGELAFGPSHYYWAESMTVGAAALLAAAGSRHTARPYSLFLLLLGAGLSVLVVTSSTYGQDAWVVPGFAGDKAPGISAVSYGIFLFLWISAWGYLAVERWQGRPPSALTATAFVVLTIGLAGIVGSFYFANYVDKLASVSGRLDAVTAGLEFATLTVALACVLLGVPTALTWMVLALAILAASNMLYVDATGESTAYEIAWMTGLFLLLASVVGFPGASQGHAAVVQKPLEPPTVERRSGLSGALLLLSVGALLLVAVASILLDGGPQGSRAPTDGPAWKYFFYVLFLVVLVLTLVWITDRFDEAVGYLKTYTASLYQRRLTGEQWRAAPPRIRTILQATGLGAHLDALRLASARLRQDVLFLGPERLFSPPKASGGRRKPRCFIVMPFSLEWSNDVHRILGDACQAAGVQPVRGDDLFTPTDILEDIWQAINGADFVIADITGRNPNVLYELGMAHSLAKPVLILSREAADIPIDLSTRRVILYGRQGAAWQADLRDKADKAIREILRNYRLAPAIIGVEPGTAETAPQGPEIREQLKPKQGLETRVQASER